MTHTKLNIALIQSDLAWENSSQNRLNFLNKIESITAPVDLIILPEMFSTGFTMQPQNVAETMDGATVKWMIETAKSKAVAICGSLVIIEDGNYYNRLLFVYPDGQHKQYDKHHRFTLAGEEKVYSAGSDKLILDYKGWRFCPLICYDLRFPVWARNTEDYEVLIYVASWPAKRMVAWDTLLKARAIENMAYCIGVNRTGVDGNNHVYSGNSAAWNPVGEALCDIPKNEEAIAIITLDKTEIESQRRAFKFLNDQDQFTLI